MIKGIYTKFLTGPIGIPNPAATQTPNKFDQKLGRNDSQKSGILGTVLEIPPKHARPTMRKAPIAIQIEILRFLFSVIDARL